MINSSGDDDVEKTKSEQLVKLFFTSDLFFCLIYFSLSARQRRIKDDDDKRDREDKKTVCFLHHELTIRYQFDLKGLIGFTFPLFLVFLLLLIS